MTGRPRSIARRLAAHLGLFLGALWVAGVAATGVILYHEEGEMLDESLRATAELLLPLTRTEYERARRADVKLPVVVGMPSSQSLFPDDPLDMPLIFMLRDRTGTVVLRSGRASEFPAAALRNGGFFQLGSHVFYQAAPDADGFQIIVGGSQRERTETLIKSVSLLTLMLAFLIPLGWLVVRRSLRQATGPMVSLNRALRLRGSMNLEPIELVDLPVELRPIVDETNSMMVRLRAALSSERAFAANSAHELRTPLAVALAQTSRLIAEARDAATLDRARQVEASLKRLGGLIERLLQLARAEAGIGLSEAETDLVPVLRLLVGEFRRKMPPGREIRIGEPLAALRSRMDPDAFGIILSNLLDNALKHGDPAVPIDVTTPAAGTVSIVNGSPVIPADRLASLVQRHQRGQAKSEGWGIGLSIVDALTRQAGGRFRLYSPARSLTGGFEALVALNADDQGKAAQRSSSAYLNPSEDAKLSNND